MTGRSPHGERGLKLFKRKYASDVIRRSPHGERGLKSCDFVNLAFPIGSLPPRGAWIEINCFLRMPCHPLVAPPTGSVD